MGDLLSEFGDIVFTLVIGYIGAIEFLYVVRHLYHWSFNHDGSDNDTDDNSLARLQEHMRQQLATARANEENAGKKAMQDGVLYEDGFRIEPNQSEIDSLKQQLKDKSVKDLKRQELEQELEKQKQIEQKTRKELEEAEAAYARQQREAEEVVRKKAQKQREEEEKRQALEKEAERKRQQEAEEAEKERERQAEEARKLIEAEQEREREQRRREQAEEEAANARRLLEAERLKEQQQRQAEEEAERLENERRLLEAERQMEESQRNAEQMAENERNILDMERSLEATMRDTEYQDEEEELTDNERQLIASIRQRDIAEQQDEASAQKEAELLKRILAARQQLGEESEEEQQTERRFGLEQDRELKQKRIDENARLFLEAEKEMADLQAHMLEAVEKREFATSLESAPQTPVIEEPCLKKIVHPLLEDSGEPVLAHKVKTQLAQSSDDSYSVSTKSLLFPGISDDASSNEPISSQQSSFSTQPSEEISTGNESQYPPQERQEPEGEDNAPAQQYSDDYLRSLDGIKSRPLSREDRSGRRIAFKKRRSSGSSNSSRDSRTSRDEELKMFTSLEEEEMRATGDSEFTPIRYSSEPTLKVKGHHRRHKRSPAKDMKPGDDSQRSSLERLGEETINPWGDVVPEHYKNTEFWKREKALSIDEELEFEKPTSSEEISYDTATNLPSASSFEEATQIQNEAALSNLRKREAKEAKEEETATKATPDDEAGSDNKTNLRLRRSPRIEEIPQYAEQWKESNVGQASNLNTPSITVDKPMDFGTWRDEHGLIMEGLSDFYDFTASVNPSRSRSTSRNPSPANTAPNTPQPRNVSFQTQNTRQQGSEQTTPGTPALSPTVNRSISNVDKPLDAGPWRDEHGLIVEGVSDFYDFTASINPSRSRSTSRNPSPANIAPSTPEPKNVSLQSDLTGAEVEIYDDTNQLEHNEFSQENITKFLDSLPTATEISEINQSNNTEMSECTVKGHLQYVLDDQPKEQGQLSPLPLVNIIDDSEASTSNNTSTGNDEEMNDLLASLRSQRSRSRSRSKSPLPTPDNIQRSLEARRFKMIKHNEDVLEKLIETHLLPESPEPEPEPESEAVTTPMTASEDEEYSQENMSLFVETLRAERERSRSRSRSRCRSPLPTADNIERSLEHSRHKHLQEKEELLRKFSEIPPAFSAPLIAIEVSEPDSFESPINEYRAEDQRSEQISRPEDPNIYSAPLAPLVSIQITEPETMPQDEEDYSREQMDSLVQSLRVNRSRSRSKSPMRLPTAENVGKSLLARRSRLIERNDEIMQELEERARTPEPPQLTVEYVYEFVETSEETAESSMRSRLSRSRTPSRSPSLTRTAADVAVERPPTRSRSRSPSRSLSPNQDDSDFHVMLNLEGSQNKTLSKNSEEYESTLANRLKLLDEEALEKLKNASEEIELRTLSPLSLDQAEAKERQSNDLLADLPTPERRKMLRCSPTTPDYDRTISEEMQDVDRIKKEMLERGFKRSTYVGESMDLVGSEYESFRREAARFQRSRTPSPSFSETVPEPGQRTAAEKRQIQDLVLAELTGSKEMRNTGAIPKAGTATSTDSDTSLAREVEDTLRIKEEMLSSGFQRSTYVGQSVDASMEWQEMRQRNADFRRSGSKSRSPLGETELAEIADIEVEATKRELLDHMLDIEAAATERQLQDHMLKEISNSSMNFQDFSRNLNPDFLENERRASDSALIQKPEILINHFEDFDVEPDEYHHFRRFSLAQEQPMEEYPNDDYIFVQQVEVRTRSGSRTWIREDFYSQDIDDFLIKDNVVAQESVEVDVEVKEEIVKSGETSPLAWVEEAEMDDNDGDDDDNEDINDDIPIDDVDLDDDVDVDADIDVDIIDELNADENEDDDDSNASEDDRRTVIDVDDEIDEDISDFNERGPAEESHHEQSECEEAEREMDRYADRDARDWAAVVQVEEIFSPENDAAEPQQEDSEGAVGGANSSPYDSDSFAIDQIYDEAIKNRKQSGILREFDSILNEMTNSFIESSSKDMDEQYALWSRTHKKAKNVEFTSNFIESERKDTEMRYLGDANVSARQSTRLRSRYGYNPVLQTSTKVDDFEVDLNYKPKREYNWRKNFKLNDDDVRETSLRQANIEKSLNDEQVDWDLEGSNDTTAEAFDIRKFSLGGESITLFSQSPEKEVQVEDLDNTAAKPQETPEATEVKEVQVQSSVVIEAEKLDKPKKKKTKKKTRKGSKASIEALQRDDDNDADDYVPPPYSRRSSSIQMETDSPKRKSRSRRSSRTSLTNEDSFGLYSPRDSVGCGEPIADIMEEYTDVKEETMRPKKIKKRKKVKETMAEVSESPKEEMNMNGIETSEILAAYETTASAVITPDSASVNMLSTLSPQDSVCVTPGSEESETNGNVSRRQTSGSLNSSAATPTTPVDTFDILKDANFYPLF